MANSLASSQSVAANDDWTSSAFSTSSKDVLGLRFSVTCSADMDGDATLYILPSLDGTTYADISEGIPAMVISDVAETTVTEVGKFPLNKAYSNVKIAVANTDITNSISVTIDYTTA